MQKELFQSVLRTDVFGRYLLSTKCRATTYR